MKNLKTVFAVLLAVIFTTSMYSCGSDDDEDEVVSFKNTTLVAGDSLIISNGAGVTWASSNKYIASVSGNKVKALRVGTATITSSKGSFTVTVTASSSLYDEPYMKWGSSMSTVKSYMSGYTLSKSTSTALIYDGKKGADYIGYVFENSALKSSCALIPTYYMDELVDFILERYIYVTKTDDDAMGFISPDMKIAVLLTATKINSSYCYMVFYTEYTGSSSNSSAKLSTFDLLPESRGLNASDNGEIKKLNDEIISRFK